MDHDALGAIALRQIRENKNVLPEDRLAAEQMLVAIAVGNFSTAVGARRFDLYMYRVYVYWYERSSS